ncbi:hypothetical protein TB2_033883 [Malus domestica]
MTKRHTHIGEFGCRVDSGWQIRNRGREHESTQSAIDESTAETAPVPDARNGVAERTPEEMVAKGIARVKKQFLRPPPIKALSNDQNDAAAKSAAGICPEVAKRGDVSRCPYNDKCRFSHDIEAYKAQKPEDIEGECPFMTAQETCPYGLACRFLGSDKDGVEGGDLSARRRSSELNGLTKDVQKLLWKNKMKFPKADAKLKALGLEVLTYIILLPLIMSLSLYVCARTESDRSLRLHPREKKLIDFREKLYLAPLTTVGNLPFRRVCKVFGADIICGEMAMCTNLLQCNFRMEIGSSIRMGTAEVTFIRGFVCVQICGSYPDTVAHTVDLIDQECQLDFIDINMGCPIDIVVNKGAGSALLTKPMRMKGIVQAASGTVDSPITIKAPEALPVLGNGDIFSYVDWKKHQAECPELSTCMIALSTCMIARGALIKPWSFTEIKEQRHWDISSVERLNILKDYVRLGLEHWGSDTKVGLVSMSQVWRQVFSVRKA